MSRPLRLLLILFLVASCGGGNSTSAPRSLDNACMILQQRPDFAPAFRAAERRWGVPVHVQMATLYQESKFIADARTPLRYALGVIPVGRQSSAYGYAQALDGTWDEYRKAEGRRGARRDNIRDATDFMGWYMSKSQDVLNISLSNARAQYLAYHEGRTGYRRGTYKRKGWLLRVSKEVADRATLYQRQLKSCLRRA